MINKHSISSLLILMKSLGYPLFFSFMSYILFLSLFYNANGNMGLLSLIPIIFIFLPICINFIITGHKGIFISLLLVLPLYFLNKYFAYIIIFILIFPAFIAFITNKLRPFNIGYAIGIVAVYFCILMAGYLVYMQQNNPSLTLYAQIYDFLYYVVLSYQNEESWLVDSKSVVKNVSLASFFLPAIVTFIILILFSFNYRLSLLISNRSYQTKYLLNDYRLPPYFRLALILIGFLAVLSHKLLEKDFILYYTLYNVFLILWLCYFYLGLEFIWQKLEAKQSMMFKVLFLVAFMLLFIECFLVICIIGFLIDMRIIKNNYFIKHKF